MAVKFTNSGQFKKGVSASPATQFKKGFIPWNKGINYKLSDKTKKAISLTMKKQWADGMRTLSKSFTNKGNYHTEETKRKISESHVKLKLTGKKNHNWKGGITSKDRLERIKFRQQMQQAVFKRDNYICQMCGSKEDLQVDHIQSWAEYVELRFSMDNCRTLCMDCHYLITYGKPKPKDIIWGHNLGRRIAK